MNSGLVSNKGTQQSNRPQLESKETYTEQFLDRLRDLLNTNAEMTPLEVASVSTSFTTKLLDRDDEYQD